MDIGSSEIQTGSTGLLERPKVPQDSLDGLIQSASETLFARYKGDESGQRVVSRTFQLIRSLRGLNDEDPFPQDRESMESMAKIQKDLIRSMVEATKSEISPEALHDTLTISGLLESFSKQNLPSGLHPKRMDNANKVRQWWNGIKAEAAVIRSLETNGYRVEIPQGDEIISMDVRGGIDFLAYSLLDRSKMLAIDAKSFNGMSNSKIGDRSRGFEVEALGASRKSLALEAIEAKNPNRSVRKVIVRVDPVLLPQLKLANREGELEALRTFLSLPDSVGKGIVQRLNQVSI